MWTKFLCSWVYTNQMIEIRGQNERKIDVRLGRIYWIELMGKMHVFHFLSKFGYDLVSRILLLFIRDEIGWFSELIRHEILILTNVWIF